MEFAGMKTFKSYEPDQILLPPALQDWLPKDHLFYFVSRAGEWQLVCLVQSLLKLVANHAWWHFAGRHRGVAQ